MKIMTREEIVEYMVKRMAEEQIERYPGTLYGDDLKSMLFLLGDPANLPADNASTGLVGKSGGSLPVSLGGFSSPEDAGERLSQAPMPVAPQPSAQTPPVIRSRSGCTRTPESASAPSIPTDTETAEQTGFTHEVRDVLEGTETARCTCGDMCDSYDYIECPVHSTLESGPTPHQATRTRAREGGHRIPLTYYTECPDCGLQCRGH